MSNSQSDLHERFRRCTGMVAGASLVCAAGLAASLAHAQTTQVTGNGLNTTVANTASGVEITGGSRGNGNTGPNLFHSFGVFNVGTGDTANFKADGLATANIIGRVTDARSDIFGTVRTTEFGAANLWLINPKGFVFGPNATLDVGGSFHASTADYLKFSNGDEFHVNAANPVLSVADPSAFGFLGTPTGRIDVLSGTVDDTTNPVTITSYLKVQGENGEGKTLSLVGGNVNIGGQVDLNNDGTPDVSGPGYILAPGGHVNLVSVASSGVATFDPTNINGSAAGPVAGNPSTRDINVSGFAQLGNINITQGSVVDAKEVSIAGGKLVIDTAAVYPGGFWLYENLGALTVGGLAAPLPAPDGGLVNVNVAGDVSIRGDTLVPVINDLSGILTFAGFLFAEVPGDAPNIRVNAQALTLSGETADIQTARFGPGMAADININANTVRIENGAAIEALNFFQGPGGNITVNTGDLVIDGGFSPGFTGLSAQALFHPGYLVFSIDPIVYFADAGTIAVNATNNVTLRNLAFISASSFAFGSGGGVTVNAQNLSLDNGGTITAESTLGGPAGNVEINASGQVILTNFSQISSTTTGNGTGGNVVIKAGQSTTVSSTSGIFASTVPPNQELLDFIVSNQMAGLGFPDWATLQSFISDVTGIPNPTIFDVLRSLRDDFGVLAIPDPMLIAGDGGAISVTTPLLTISGGAVSSSTGWDGNAGAVVGKVGSLVVENDGEIRVRSGLFDPASGEVFGAGVGNAGTLRVDAQGSITISGGSISSTTIGDGKGGDVVLNAAQDVNITNGGSVSADSLALAATDATKGVGGDTGRIEITGGNSITLDRGAISTRAVAADGGDIKLTAPNIVRLEGSQITTSVESGKGKGGNINIDPQFVIVNNSFIIANAFGGPGGNITIIADNFLQSASSAITASSALSTPGVIEVRSPENNVENNIAQLPAAFIDASALLRGLCTARRTGAASSFVVAGRGGVPVDADGYLPSFGTDVAVGMADMGDPMQSAAGRTGEPPLSVALLLANTLDCAR
ncbi:MAG TPA: filamentous hemagglutinin N-terminal domain-containing protein [Burkholderiales bacterium]|nr:filamentous hemagglutinin N-terminal domain-containing protein [Burkholderiales bacterium]